MLGSFLNNKPILLTLGADRIGLGGLHVLIEALRFLFGGGCKQDVVGIQE